MKCNKWLVHSCSSGQPYFIRMLYNHFWYSNLVSRFSTKITVAIPTSNRTWLTSLLIFVRLNVLNYLKKYVKSERDVQLLVYTMLISTVHCENASGYFTASKIEVSPFIDFSGIHTTSQFSFSLMLRFTGTVASTFDIYFFSLSKITHLLTEIASLLSPRVTLL